MTQTGLKAVIKTGSKVNKYRSNPSIPTNLSKKNRRILGVSHLSDNTHSIDCGHFPSKKIAALFSDAFMDLANSLDTYYRPVLTNREMKGMTKREMKMWARK